MGWNGLRRTLTAAAITAGFLSASVPVLAASAGAAQASLRLTSVTPANHATGVSGTAPIVLTFNAPLARNTALPGLVPSIVGHWARSGSTLTFTPAGAYNPDAVVGVILPGKSTGITGADRQTLPTSSSVSFTTQQGSVLRAQQILARLGYLPLQFQPRGAWALSDPAYEQAVFNPPAGSFVWRFKPPSALEVLWHEGAATTMFTGALMSFESRTGLNVDGVLSWPVWSALLSAGRALSTNYNRAGYDYALASKTQPESLDVWDNATHVLHTLANTGISLSPTSDGNYPVYLRLRTQTMRGVDPWGHKYADPVAFVAYFDGSQAVHYFDRASYGYPQSLGCVEVPYVQARTAWPYLTIGTIVTVEG